ncbi:DinB family protein [Arthrospiribacter ruber]|uniref:DinB family protein n=1 Tax=Arthrospiribacter ruber TaxID=2487934 RepID=A0A951IZB2_9BACT|nr:DinB family protein [Arthrospiribacter ruber]MBW3466826.1 DinB family protein [Arthrospiribacter ruber]MBW3469618.1 DinB family protein [Arthrospiribacter ruber]MBW3470307.1 DinB family protein [Arthrospiribacter ruber]
MKKYLLILCLLHSLWSCSTKLEDGKSASFDHASAIMESLEKSKAYTYAILEQMPDSLYSYRPTPELMTFSEHYVHNAIFTCNQLANRLNLENPYKDFKRDRDFNKKETIAEVDRMYAFMTQSLESMTSEDLEKEIEFGKEAISAWRLFNIVENHNNHHRGYSLVYLRMNGIVPKGYFGW